MDIIWRGEEDKKEDLVTMEIDGFIVKKPSSNDRETSADKNYVINPEWESADLEIVSSFWGSGPNPLPEPDILI